MRGNGRDAATTCELASFELSPARRSDAHAPQGTRPDFHRAAAPLSTFHTWKSLTLGCNIMMDRADGLCRLSDEGPMHSRVKQEPGMYPSRRTIFAVLLLA